MTVHTIMPLKNGMSGTCLPYRLLYRYKLLTYFEEKTHKFNEPNSGGLKS